MGSSAGGQPSYRAPLLWSVWLPLLAVVVILAADAIEGPKTAFVGVLVAVPMLSAVFGTPRITAMVAVITWLAAFGFGLAAADGNVPAQYVRLAILALVGVAATAATHKRVQIERDLSAARLAAAEADLAKQAANSDWLTGLLNRRGLDEEFDRRAESGGVLIMIDVDDMKRVNDTLGHQAGDEVIMAIAGRLRGCTNAKDAVGRWGGDEFVVVTDATEAQAQAIGRRIEAEVGGQPVQTALGSFTVTLSWGVSAFGPQRNVDEALSRADSEMYRNKQDTRGVES